MAEEQKREPRKRVYEADPDHGHKVDQYQPTRVREYGESGALVASSTERQQATAEDEPKVLRRRER